MEQALGSIGNVLFGEDGKGGLIGTGLDIYERVVTIRGGQAGESNTPPIYSSDQTQNQSSSGGDSASSVSAAFGKALPWILVVGAGAVVWKFL